MSVDAGMDARIAARETAGYGVQDGVLDASWYAQVNAEAAAQVARECAQAVPIHHQEVMAAHGPVVGGGSS